MSTSSRGGNRATDTTTMSSADRIDVLCDAFEHAFQRGKHPDFSSYLAECEDADRPSLFAELMLLDVDLRREGGDLPTSNDYLDSYPEYAAVVETIAFKHRLTFSLQDKPHGRDRPTIGHFQLQEKVGEGAAGEVWKAFDPRLRREVAIKMPRQRYPNDQEVHRFLREGQAAAQLKHPAIVSVHDVCGNEQNPYIVSDFVEGDDLGTVLDHQAYNAREAAELCAKLAEGLHHAHEAGVVHRDFKPANVMIDCIGNPHITDFGMAKWSGDADQMTLEGHVLGTPAYMSPEQARGDVSVVDRRTDIYSLGAVLYQLLTGEYPFSGEISAVVQSVIHDESRAPRSICHNVPRDLETVCLKAMAKNPDHRYATAEEFADDLRRYLNGEVIHARRTRAWERAFRAIRRRPAAAVAVALGIVACFALSVAWMLAEDNRALLGIRTVTISTEPPGAEIVFVPLGKVSGRPLEQDLVRAPGVSPVEVQLRPGNYLVVAKLPDGRFHEVFRFVPAGHKTQPGAYNHQFWQIGADGEVVLPSITIPDADIDAEMAMISGRGEIKDYYIDTMEVSIAQFCKQVSRGRVPDHVRETGAAAEQAIWLNYDRAVAAAEAMGKRLPTEEEFEHAATNRGKSEFAWGAWSGKVEAAGATVSSWGNVGEPHFDRLDVVPPVYGLCSNVAEWTTSWADSGYRADGSTTDEYISPNHYRVVRGGDMSVIKGRPNVTRSNRDPKKRSVVPRLEMHRGLGFRCVRSTTPRYFDSP